MRKRTLARGFALQILYQIDITRDTAELAINKFFQAQSQDNIDAEVSRFTAELVKGVTDNLEIIDEKITQHALNWQFKRIAVVDRNILRLGGYELLFREDIPPKVSINEAVELAKKYSGLEAGKFVNGILDKIKLEKKR
ncbi:MAG: transcription antitermination factor NusB [Candidatus Omnitrophica bacterium]|nr:transcription antitermination factor NusB [Candidatus Omnitrophota bacterium]